MTVTWDWQGGLLFGERVWRWIEHEQLVIPGTPPPIVRDQPNEQLDMGLDLTYLDRVGSVSDLGEGEGAMCEEDSITARLLLETGLPF